MKLIIGLIIVLVAGAALFAVRAIASGGSDRSPPSAHGMYLGLRNLALTTKAGDLGLSPNDAREPYGIIMDMNVSGHTATITSFATGDASLYLSTGGGTIGSGQASEEVAAAAKRFVAAAAPHLNAMDKTSAQPLPGPGEVIFYVLTMDGIYTARRAEEALGERRDALSPLFYAGQQVLTEIRLLQERQEAK